MSVRRWVPGFTFAGVFVGHALYIRHLSLAPSPGWAPALALQGGRWGFAAYLQGQDYFMSFSYALGATFSVWALGELLRSRRAEAAAGAAGGLTLVGVLAAAGCFLTGCCGSPMLAVYASILGVKTLGGGKAVVAGVTLVSVLAGYLITKRRCRGSHCGCHCGPWSGAAAVREDDLRNSSQR